jgi:ribosome maturation factor RimP
MNKETLITKISALITPTIATMGYSLWGCELVNAVGVTLKIYIDSEAGINLDDCRKVSNQVSAILDAQDAIANKYHLEVSSPGMDRCLFNEEQYKKFISSDVRIRLSMPINGKRTYVGKIAEIIAGNVGIITAEGNVIIPIDQVEKARIIPQF